MIERVIYISIVGSIEVIGQNICDFFFANFEYENTKMLNFEHHSIDFSVWL